MLKRLYVHNFRCLENFEFCPGPTSSTLLIGRNGSGKSTIANAFEILQRIGRGINRVGQLVQEKDIAQGRKHLPIRIEIETELSGKPYQYILALELPENFKELRILEERLMVAGMPVYSRNLAQVTLPKTQSTTSEAQFYVDWHLVALPVIQVRSHTDPLHIFKNWLAQSIILSPIPALMKGNSADESLEPSRDGVNLGDWLSGLLGQYPAAYSTISEYLKRIIPDIAEFRNDPTSKDSKSLNIHFTQHNNNLIINFADLSDGEKCFFLCAVVIAANKAYGPLFCFWDEPDSYLSISEIAHFVMDLRKAFQNSGQLLLSSHNAQAINTFSCENTWLLDRKSHLEPTLIRLLEEIPLTGDLIDELILDDIRL
jgi:predicted ATPase